LSTATRDAVAHALLRIGAVHYYEREPYKFTSGVLSPVYVDCRRPISFVEPRNLIVEAATRTLDTSSFDVVAGGETAGIPYAAILAHVWGKEMVYVRKKPKGFGKNLLIEGELRHGARALLVEDLTFDAQSKIRFATALREGGARCDTTLSVFNYGVASSVSRLSENGLRLEYLTDWESVLKVAVELGRFSEQQRAVVLAFLRDPPNWAATAGHHVAGS